MTLVKAGLGAAAASVFGMALWIAVGYFTGYEVSYVAIVLGASTGFGALAAVSSRGNLATGAIAAVVAVLGIFGAKVGLVYLEVEKTFSSHYVVTSIDVKNKLADDMIDQATAAGKPIKWMGTSRTPDGRVVHDWPNDYPTDVITEVNNRWTKLSADEKAALKAECQAVQDQHEQELHATVKPQVRSEAWKSTFGMFDILWVILAIVTAFRVGASNAED